MIKTSIRFFDDIPVRSVWDDATSRWWFCAVDVVQAIAETKNPRIYWATVKRRNLQLFADCKQLKLRNNTRPPWRKALWTAAPCPACSAVP